MEAPPSPTALMASAMTEVGLSDESDIHDEQIDLRTWPGAEGAVPVLTSRVISARAAAVVWKGY